MESDRIVPADPVPPPDDGPVAGEPHVRLVHSVLRSSRGHADWQVEGGPRPQLPRGWTGLWNDAVRRQMDLAEESETDARRTVQALLDQLTRLDREAEWFRADPVLRERAIAETLLYWTGLGPAVPSSPAQAAWHRQQGLRPVDFARIQAIAAAQDDWLEAWNIWATTR
ncbi:hypothetical protein [Actinoplanes couchii]|uniref:Uncharacterized protein n=1 Tax=Actinoplanes couchii TaxID=403638 RepID=A0ABQ3X401_9ACTN|nr:hypothetical protein [Actinoplanes couchii]MDR6326406.1 hypothetical protein [Actinoplanes couchii]GID53242.1 hypothetical protein Aco03nite_016460 [Actinoplanes couchii]